MHTAAFVKIQVVLHKACHTAVEAGGGSLVDNGSLCLMFASSVVLAPAFL